MGAVGVKIRSVFVHGKEVKYTRTVHKELVIKGINIQNKEEKSHKMDKQGTFVAFCAYCICVEKTIDFLCKLLLSECANNTEKGAFL